MSGSYFRAVGVLAGTIIGAGVFSLPYVAYRIGLVPGALYLAAFALLYFVLHLMYVRVLELHPRDHRFVFVADRYLPRAFSRAGGLVILSELLFTLTVYLSLVPSFSRLLFPAGFTGVYEAVAVVLFWAFGSAFMFAGLRGRGWAEVAGLLGILGILLAVLFASRAGHGAVPLFQPVRFSDLLLPFGPLLFSFAGRPALSHVLSEHRRSSEERVKRFSLSAAVFWGTIIPAIVYFFFILGALRLSEAVSPSGVETFLVSPSLRVLIGLLGILTIWTSYFMIGENVREILRADLRRSSFAAGFVPVAVPLFLYAVGFKNFLDVLSFTGGVLLALEGIFVVTLWRFAFPRHRLRVFAWVLYAVFLVSLAYTLFP